MQKNMVSQGHENKAIDCEKPVLAKQNIQSVLYQGRIVDIQIPEDKLCGGETFKKTSLDVMECPCGKSLLCRRCILGMMHIPALNRVYACSQCFSEVSQREYLPDARDRWFKLVEPVAEYMKRESNYSRTIPGVILTYKPSPETTRSVFDYYREGVEEYSGKDGLSGESIKCGSSNVDFDNPDKALQWLEGNGVVDFNCISKKNYSLHGKMKIVEFVDDQEREIDEDEYWAPLWNPQIDFKDVRPKSENGEFAVEVLSLCRVMSSEVLLRILKNNGIDQKDVRAQYILKASGEFDGGLVFKMACNLPIIEFKIGPFFVGLTSFINSIKPSVKCYFVNTGELPLKLKRLPCALKTPSAMRSGGADESNSSDFSYLTVKIKKLDKPVYIVMVEDDWFSRWPSRPGFSIYKALNGYKEIPLLCPGD